MTKECLWPKLTFMTTATALLHPGAETDPISEAISIREAAARLGLNRQYVKGYAQAIGIRLVRSRASLLMNRHDFDCLRQRLAPGDPGG